MKGFARLTLTASFALAFILATVPARAASVHTVNNGNSSITVNLAGWVGLNNWTVDGQNRANQQWFWYRVGNSGPEYSIDALGSPTVVAGPGTLNATYTGSQFSIQVMYSLVGGAAGSGNSNLGEQVRISNTGNSTLDFHFFVYSDMLNQIPGMDTVQLGKSLQNKFDEAYQTDGASTLDTVLSGASHGEASLVNSPTMISTLSKLINGGPTTLNDNPQSGPGHATWAMQWDLAIAAGNSFTVGGNLNLVAVPEPSSWAFALVGLITLTGFLKLKRNQGRN